MNEKKDPPKLKSIPRQMVMKEAFDQNYGAPALPAECVGCKNRPDLPCEGCDHWEAKKAVTQSKKMAAVAVSTLNSPTKLKHDIIERLMAKKHEYEGELDGTELTFGSLRDELRGKIYGLSEAIDTIRGME